MTRIITPQDVRRAEERAATIRNMIVLLIIVFAVTAVIMVPVFMYEPDVGGRGKKQDLKDLTAIAMFFFAAPSALVASLFTIAYMRWPRGWTSALYHLGLFVILMANAVLLLSGGWYSFLIRGRPDIPGWLTWPTLVLSLFVALAPIVQRRLRNR